MKAEQQKAVIVLDHVTRTYGNKRALDDVTLHVPSGGVIGLVGANGAGKTTLIRHLLGLLKPQSGRVRVFGLDPVSNTVKVLSRLGYLSEDRDLPPWMSVRQLLKYTRGFYSDWDDAYAAQLLERFQLLPEAQVRNLSKGELAKAGLLLALAHRPELLVLDEPSSGLDPVVRREMLEAVVRTVGDEGRTVLFSSHLLDEISRVSDRVAMLARGKLVLQGDLPEIVESHRRLVVRLPDGDRKNLPGVLAMTGGPVEWTVICNGRHDELLNSIRQAKGEVLENSGATFEEIFHARVTAS